MRHRVAAKILTAVAAVLTGLVVLLLGLAWLRSASEADALQEDCKTHLRAALAQGSAGGKKASLARADTERLERVASEFSERGARIASLRLAGSGLQTYLPVPAARGGDSAPDFCALLSPLPSSARLTQTLPGGARAEVALDFSAARSEDGRDLANAGELAFLFWLLGLAFVYACLNRWVTRPAEALVRFSRSLADGDRNLRLAVESQDEFGQIRRAYNALIDDLFQTQYQADTDGLTQLYNHRYLQEKIGDAMAQARLADRSMAILLIDLDRFKILNDTYGHLTGDRYLRQIADLLRRAVHLDGIAGRYGGDEFLVVLPHADEKRAVQMAQRIRSLMEADKFRPHPLEEPLPMAFSLGMAVYPGQGADTQELIAYADAALYTEKNGGFNLLEFSRQVEAEYLKEHAAALSQKGKENTDIGGCRMLFNLVVAVDKRDAYTKHHSEHVAEWAVRLARALGFAPETLYMLRIAGLLHDVGKIGVPDAILRKPGALTAEEYDIMKGHVALAERLIQQVPCEAEVREVVACHHERWDGGGYPRGRAGVEMPRAGRLLSIVDAYSAMSLDRPYRSGLSLDEICRRLREGAGSQFDPSLVEPFVDLLLREAASAAPRSGEGGTPGTAPETLLTHPRTVPGKKMQQAA